jgi:hypothetical protein
VTSPTPSPALDLTPDPNGSLSQAQMQQLFRVVADLENDKRQRERSKHKVPIRLLLASLSVAQGRLSTTETDSGFLRSG